MMVKNNLCKIFRTGLVHLSAFVFVSALAVGCSDDEGVAGGASGDAGITAVTDREVAGVSQKGPFVTGSAVTVQELDGITLKQTGKSFKGTIKSDKGNFAIKDINLQSQYAILEANGYYRDEISGKKSSGTVTLRALTDLSNRKTVNINLLTHLEYERVMYLVNKKKMSIAEAKALAETEVLASFAIEGDFGESEDLNIFKSGDGNAALLAVSVLMQGDVDVAGLTERMGEFSIALAEGGSWDDADTKTEIADWACDIDLKGSLSKVRKNVEGWKYADSVPAFEKYVTNFWWNNYGLGACNAKRENETKRNINKLSKLYNEYFVCEKGRWVIPIDDKSSSSLTAKSSSSSAAKSSSSKTSKSSSSGTSAGSATSSSESKSSSSETAKSSSSVTSSDSATSSSSYPIENLSSSSVASSSSIYNPFAENAVKSVPQPLSFLDSTYDRKGYTSYGNGKQEVWFFTARKGFGSGSIRDSAISALVEELGKRGFTFEGSVKNDSLDSMYDDTSYVYLKKDANTVYKVAITKWYASLSYCICYDVKVVVLRDGFEEVPTTDYSSLRYETAMPEEMSFLKDFATSINKESWNDSLQSTSWWLYRQVDRENLKTETMDDPPNEEKVKALADSVELLKRALEEKGFVLNKIDSTELTKYYYTYESDLAKYEVTVFVNSSKIGDAVILGNWYYDYSYNIRIVTYYKKNGKRLN